MTRELLCIDWKNAYNGVTLIWPDARIATAEWTLKGSDRQWQVSGKKIQFTSPYMIELGYGDMRFSIIAKATSDSLSTRYEISGPDKGIFTVLPTFFWRLIESRTRASSDGERILSGDPTAMFAAASALNAELAKIPQRYQGGSLSWLAEADLRYAAGGVRDSLNRIAEAIELARKPEHLVESVLTLLDRQASRPEAA